MKSLPLLSFIILFISLAFPVNAQDIGSIYGLEPLLHNGRKYSFILSHETIGHPFLHTQNYESGYVLIRNEKFEDQLLNYDIYNQELILKYKDIHGANDLIKLSKAWLRGFNLHDNEFVLMETGNGQKEFFQVIGYDSLKVLYQWQKKMSLTKEVGRSNYHFSEPVKTMYLFRDEAFYKFRNNKSFLAYFEPGQRDSVKKYLTQNKIRVKRASDQKMLNLITFCSRIKH
ncbi:MAG: hypothetical protein AMS26_11105 [Bacteroides sp. SM23_62]|nr:MAG: hypothetical protein AMS26_11105 [Bacteroides sp. SM23_62]